MDVRGSGMTLKSPASTNGSSALSRSLRILEKPRHPFEFVGIFFGCRRIAVGQIEARDPQRAALGVDTTPSRKRA